MTVPNQASRDTWLQGPSAHCATVPKGEFLSWRIILLGAPGVGKGTQAELLNQRLLACHLSTATFSRQRQPIVMPIVMPSKSRAMEDALVYVQRGELVSDATVWGMVGERGECLHCAGGFILDGFPRTMAQAVSLKQFLEQSSARGLPPHR